VGIFRIYLQGGVSLRRAHQLEVNAEGCFELHGRQILELELRLVKQRYAWG